MEYCNLRTGTWMIAEMSYPDGSSKKYFWQLNQDIPATSIITWMPEPAPSPNGGMFTLTILPTDMWWRQYSTTFEGPVELQVADEQEVSSWGILQRFVTVKGVYDGGLRAFYGFDDISKRAVFIASDTVQFDVTNLSLQEGAYFPLTICQGPGRCQTVLLFHGASPGKG